MKFELHSRALRLRVLHSPWCRRSRWTENAGGAVELSDCLQHTRPNDFTTVHEICVVGRYIRVVGSWPPALPCKELGEDEECPDRGV